MVMEVKVAKIRKNKIKEENKVNMDTNYSLKSMIKILITLLLIFSIFYLITYFLIDKKQQEEVSTPVVIDTSKITLNQLLNRKEQEYYVLVTKNNSTKSNYMETNYNTIYNNYIKTYEQKADSLEFYYVDLDNALNKNYVSEDLNITDNLEEMKLNEDVLFKIKNKKIEKYYVGKQTIIDKLSRL